MMSRTMNTDLHDAPGPAPSKENESTLNSGNNLLVEQQDPQTSAAAPVTSEPRQSSSRAEKQCWVCFGTDEVDDKQVWLHPCQCKGSAMWVHELCLQRWIDEKQKGQLNVEVRCAQCNSPYRMVFPRVGPIARLLSMLDVMTAKLSPVIGSGLIASALHWQLSTMGAVAVINVYGIRRGVANLRNWPPLFLFIGLPAIPCALIGLQLTRWRARFAHWIYRALHPPVDGSTTLRFIVPALGNRSTMRDLLACLLFPFIASRVGRTIWRDHYPLNPPKYALMGGAVYSGCHAVFSIYYRYMQVYRGEHRKILNRNDRDDASNAQQVPPSMEEILGDAMVLDDGNENDFFDDDDDDDVIEEAAEAIAEQ